MYSKIQISTPRRLCNVSSIFTTEARLQNNKRSTVRRSVNNRYTTYKVYIIISLKVNFKLKMMTLWANSSKQQLTDIRNKSNCLIVRFRQWRGQIVRTKHRTYWVTAKKLAKTCTKKNMFQS